MDPQLSGNASRGTRQAQQKRGEHPVHHRALTAVQACACEIIEGALAVFLFAQFLVGCSSSILAETLSYTASFSSPWRGKQHVLEQHKTLFIDQL